MAEFQGVSILMGAVSETDSLRKTVNTVLEICDHSDLTEIIICYSKNATPECLNVIYELCEKECDVPVIAFEQKRSFMGFVNDMIDAATGTHCVTIDSDLALDLGLVAEMIDGAKKEPEVIFSASRWMKGCEFHGYSFVKKIINFLAQKFLSILFMKRLTDFTIPMQIAPTDLYQSIIFEETNFGILLELVLKPLRLGYQFKELPTNCYKRTEGKSSNSAKQIFSYLKVALRIRFMSKESIIKPNLR